VESPGKDKIAERQTVRLGEIRGGLLLISRANRSGSL
jgi:hypothetical protein